MMKTLSLEVQNALEDLRAKELKAIKTSIAVAQEGKASMGTRETLKAEIEDIRKAVRANLEKLNALERANRASDERVATLERLVRCPTEAESSCLRGLAVARTAPGQAKSLEA